MPEPDRLAAFRAKLRAYRTHADLGHSGSWASCSAPACRDAQRFVPSWPEADLGDPKYIAEAIRAGLRIETGRPEPCGLSPRARVSALTLCGAGLIAALLLLAWSLQ